jgi:hypothetical protein
MRLQSGIRICIFLLLLVFFGFTRACQVGRRKIMAPERIRTRWILNDKRIPFRNYDYVFVSTSALVVCLCYGLQKLANLRRLMAEFRHAYSFPCDPQDLEENGCNILSKVSESMMASILSSPVLRNIIDNVRNALDRVVTEDGMLDLGAACDMMFGGAADFDTVCPFKNETTNHRL